MAQSARLAEIPCSWNTVAYVCKAQVEPTEEVPVSRR